MYVMNCYVKRLNNNAKSMSIERQRRWNTEKHQQGKKLKKKKKKQNILTSRPHKNSENSLVLDTKQLLCSWEAKIYTKAWKIIIAM